MKDRDSRQGSRAQSSSAATPRCNGFCSLDPGITHLPPNPLLEEEVISRPDRVKIPT